MQKPDSSSLSRWKANLAESLGGRKPDYLIVQHMEPDHSSGIGKVLEMYPDIVLVCSAKCRNTIPQFFPECDLADRVRALEALADAILS